MAKSSKWVSDSYWLPKKKPEGQAIFKGKHREHLISKVMESLSDWRSSPFENEGSCVAGFRGALCLQGHSWSAADTEARGLVADALRLIGAVRPTWDQGQREYTVADEDCKWCAGPLPPDATAGLRRVRFCSTECAKASFNSKSEQSWLKNSAVAWSAYRLILRSRVQPRKCDACGKMYSPVREKSDSKYCSKDCFNQGRLKYTPVKCMTCKAEFRPVRKTARYCSVRCKDAAASVPKRSLVCLCCGVAFTAPTSRAKFCSRTCKGRYRFLPSAPNVIDITPFLFDREFTQPGVQICTAEVFDRMFG
ncbi:hypothetical protein GHK46_27170 [Sinorhizobium medicae]|uniref:hypothetical protein n=1 Tax=Sinorhizobium medicae TaxID=110321 RepID=UPI0012963AC4|nr:hypothetical protein [Sinorhizobium medicae]MQW00866.1 hypothetical protein [Sinorhizobium medicae]